MTELIRHYGNLLSNRRACGEKTRCLNPSLTSIASRSSSHIDTNRCGRGTTPQTKPEISISYHQWWTLMTGLHSSGCRTWSPRTPLPVIVSWTSVWCTTPTNKVRVVCSTSRGSPGTKWALHVIAAMAATSLRRPTRYRFLRPLSERQRRGSRQWSYCNSKRVRLPSKVATCQLKWRNIQHQAKSSQKVCDTQKYKKVPSNPRKVGCSKTTCIR